MKKNRRKDWERFLIDSLEGIALIHPDGTKEYVKDMEFPEEQGEDEMAEIRFGDYLKTSWTEVQKAAENGDDNGDLGYFNNLCRKGVLLNRSALEPSGFLETYHRCIAAINRRVAVLEKYWPSQVILFRNHDPAQIVAEQEAIREEWKKKKCFLSPKMVNALFVTSGLISSGWEEFKREYLPIPKNPESKSLGDWQQVHQALDRLPMVGWATAWYLIRNLYGAPVFKPDIHICAIANHFFSDADDPLSAMANAVCELWESVCEDKRFLPVHLGEVDFILWWYRQATGLPEIQAPASSSC